VGTDEKPPAPVAAVMIDHSARRGIVGVVGADYSGATWDVFRKAKIEVLRRRSSVTTACGPI